MNTIKTTLLLAILTAILLVIGFFIGGRQGVTLAFFMAIIMNFGAYWFSDKIVLKMYGAREIAEGDNPRLHSIVRSASQIAGLPMPRVYIVPSPGANAFATGRNPEHAAVAATEGILQILNDDELTAVMAHELGHIRNRDTLISAIAATIAGAISYIAFMAHWIPFMGSDDDDSRGNIVAALLVAFLAPVAAALVQMAISRQREFMADRASAEISRKPLSLASALEKLHFAARKIPLKANPASAHMFIVNPLFKKDISSLFSTHPPVEERIERLRTYAGEGSN